MQRQLIRVPWRSDQGLTLVELAVAVLILSLGTIAALRATDQSRLAIGGAEDRVLAQLAARNRAEELQLLGAAGGRALPGVVTLGGQAFTLRTQTKSTAGGLTEVTISAVSERGPGAGLVIYIAPRFGP